MYPSLPNGPPDFPVTDAEGMYVMPSPDVEWDEQQMLGLGCCPAGIGKEVWGLDPALITRGYEGLGAVTRPPAWKWAVALAGAGAVVWVAMKYGGKVAKA